MNIREFLSIIWSYDIFNVCYREGLSMLSTEVGEKWMRDKRNPKDVCGEANFSVN